MRVSPTKLVTICFITLLMAACGQKYEASGEAAGDAPGKVPAEAVTAKNSIDAACSDKKINASVPVPNQQEFCTALGADYAALIRNGQYRVQAAQLAGDHCVATITISGSYQGNTYDRTLDVCAF